MVGTGCAEACRSPRLLGALMLTLLSAGCSSSDPCAKYVPASTHAVAPAQPGTDVSDHMRMPVALIRCRAKHGVIAAQLALARAYEAGRGVPRDPRRAAKWYRRAAQPTIETNFTAPQAGPNAPYGHTIPHPPATQLGPGNAEAQYRLGLLYLDGHGLARDRARARKWLERAARQGHVGARAKLAELTEASGPATRIAGPRPF